MSIFTEEMITNPLKIREDMDTSERNDAIDAISERIESLMDSEKNIRCGLGDYLYSHHPISPIALEVIRLTHRAIDTLDAISMEMFLHNEDWYSNTLKLVDEYCEIARETAPLKVRAGSISSEIFHDSCDYRRQI